MIKHVLHQTQICLFVFFVVGLAGCNPTEATQQPSENTIASSIIEDLRLSDTSQFDSYDCADFINKYAQSLQFYSGDDILANTLIFIDFDEVYMSWEDFDLQVVCEVANHGVYRSLGEFNAPNDGVLWYIHNDE